MRAKRRLVKVCDAGRERCGSRSRRGPDPAYCAVVQPGRREPDGRRRVDRIWMTRAAKLNEVRVWDARPAGAIRPPRAHEAAHRRRLQPGRPEDRHRRLRRDREDLRRVRRPRTAGVPRASRLRQSDWRSARTAGASPRPATTARPRSGTPRPARNWSPSAATGRELRGGVQPRRPAARTPAATRAR